MLLGPAETSFMSNATQQRILAFGHDVLNPGEGNSFDKVKHLSLTWAENNQLDDDNS
jgi:hypothetical protein